MRRLLWPLGLVVAFGAGVAVGGVPRHGQVAAPDVERLEKQLSVLQARLRAKDSAAAHQSRVAAGAPMPAEPEDFEGRRRGRFNSATAADDFGARPRPERADRAPADSAPVSTSPGRVPAAAGAPPTVDAALERIYRYFDDAAGTRGASRVRELRQLTEDLKTMGPAGAEALKRVLTSATSADERRTAAQLLGELGGPGALPALQDVLEKDGDVLLRRAAASGLRRLQSPDSIPLLEGLMVNPSEDRFVRMSAASGLAQMGQVQGVAGLGQIFDEANADGRGREMAFRALNALNDDRAVPFMRRVLTSDAEPTYRLQAIKFLTAQGDRQSLAALQQVMQSPTEQPSIRDAARQAHVALGGG